MFALEQSLTEGWDIEEPFVLSEHTTITPLDMAIRLEHDKKVGRQRYLRLSAEINLYADLCIVWNPTKKVIGCYDKEHLMYTTLGTWSDFSYDPSKCMDSVV